MPNQGGNREQPGRSGQQGQQGQQGQRNDETRKASPGQQNPEKRSQEADRSGKRQVK